MTALAVVVGMVLRAWYIFHQPMSADEAVVGLMAQQILHGHFVAFYWGNVYGGVEPYLVAPFVGTLGPSTWSLDIVPIILGAAAALITWRVAGRLVTRREVAALAGAVVWVVPQTAVSNATIDSGFRGVTLLCGLGLVLLALRAGDGSRTWPTFAALGLVAGVGWWSSPEVVYYMAPALWLVAFAVARDTGPRRGRRWGARLLVAAAAFALGALPWLWANVRSGFSSLNAKAFELAPGAPGYGGRLHIFVRYMLPMLLSLRAPLTGSWLLVRPLALGAVVVAVAACLVAMVLCFRGDDRGRALAVGVVLFPFLLALSPATWFWGDGRYANLGLPLVVLLLVAGFEEVTRRKLCAGSRRRAVMVGLVAPTAVVVVLSLSVANFAVFVEPSYRAVQGWGDPDGRSIMTVAALESRHIRLAYADYWVAYKLDYLSDGRLQITTVGNDVDRWPLQHAVVQRAKTQAWLFTTTSGASGLQFAFTPSVQGPDGVGEQTFRHDLTRLGIGYRVVCGLLAAVIPDRSVAPKEIDHQPTRAG